MTFSSLDSRARFLAFVIASYLLNLLWVGLLTWRLTIWSLFLTTDLMTTVGLALSPLLTGLVPVLVYFEESISFLSMR